MSSQKQTILLIDDEPQIRKFLRLALEAHNYFFIAAENGHDGIMLAGQKHPDLIILDLGLADADGQKVLLRVYVGHLRQKIEKNPASPKMIINEPGVGYRFGD